MLHGEFRKRVEDQAISIHENELDVNDGIWCLSQSIRVFREAMIEFETETRRWINEQMCTLEGLILACDSLLYDVCGLYCDRAGAEDDTPEHP